MTSDHHHERRRSSKSSKHREHSSGHLASDSHKSKERRRHERDDEEYSPSLAAKLEKVHDSNGCCNVHSHVQIAKKKIMGGWKVVRDCPACKGEDIGLDDDRLSVNSGRSGKSAKSCKSTKSNRSTKSGGGGDRGRKREKTPPTPKYDAEGYCCFHPAVRVAKKKTMGGWKLLVDVCPDCEEEGVGAKGGGRSRSLRRSLSRIRGRSSSRAPRDDDDTQSAASSLSKYSSRSKDKKSLGPRKVKNLKIRDQNRVPGRYSGYVDENSRPNGRGIIQYENGMEWTGTWCEGEQVSGKLGGCKSKF